ncbi:undecaprenyl-diphosphate phosphatase [Nitrogeniibacter mangrovi]|uniref:Undecaprenyl-diphosphatase n=1 Tax=Nitrogeniibacter mangrovi TaxID=2016596 RepID=A0A6C1B3Z3_9RHOO|nr:undecaprenyl-diphosphate phosphatase [Nitrogeniibacter mangrovi]QID16914.1 undecaprenyl-diphosphate phosphatase [Nitrogeniibacter mangrovi]
MDLPLLAKALILGIIEGLTEFLPVSSTGHLIIFGDLLDYTDAQSKVFKIVIQLAAILAVCWDYRARLIERLHGATGITRHYAQVELRENGLWRSLPRYLKEDSVAFWFNLFIAFLPAAVLGLMFYKTIKGFLFNPLTVATMLVLGGVLILYLEKRAYHPRIDSVDRMRWPDALKVGFAQSLAMIPGTSRSGSTIMGGLIFGLSRKTATEFSFFLAIPTMFAATVYDVYKNWSLLHMADLPVFAVGFVASFLAAMVAVKAFLRFVSGHSFALFAWYRIVFGLVVLISWKMGWVTWHAD